jgi:pimeloyl-ACP methyl ester carboxylesterase
MPALARTLPDRWLHPEHATQPALRELVAAMAESIGVEGQRNQQQANLGRPDSRPDLPRIQCGTVLICGREDGPTPVCDHEEIAALVPRAHLHVIDTCAHLSPLEQPLRVSALLRAWLEDA